MVTLSPGGCLSELIVRRKKPVCVCVCGVQPQTACSTYLCCAQWPCPCPCPCPLGESIFQSMERNMTASSFYSCELTVNRFISRFYTSSFLFIKFPSRWLDHVMTFYHFSYPFVQSGYNVTLLTCTCICVCLRFIKRESGSAMKCFMAVVGSLKWSVVTAVHRVVCCVEQTIWTFYVRAVSKHPNRSTSWHIFMKLCAHFRHLGLPRLRTSNCSSTARACLREVSGNYGHVVLKYVVTVSMSHGVRRCSSTGKHKATRPSCLRTICWKDFFGSTDRPRACLDVL